ncbi:hypothetical protein CBE01nite_14650 [Clostridium beijerinckii]|uniref:Peptidoglycan-binding protein n=1 Tax=Clostridium beijerinckii TaxID=1520 RepID=A0AB74VBF9_CLOBE|nr:peptidoglycan-binding protein [Clostridium beijerinckii]NRZ27919.1 putative chitinase [Clostridium beijerinckii]NYB96302.1 putative chitinase [Clostridium beijerinckii]OOM20302.1 putative peptidoglycan binding domain protein [Clostridium beijerinckii]QUN33684.1 peptidoglycan-binding protein [Clostridium beijerinckii]SQB01490.1 peptidoglycan binding domain-containing protein [Clostridium beijerinckii]
MLLEKGSTGSYVTYLQYALKIKCCYFDIVNGEFSTTTYNSVIKYQNSKRLTANGVVDDTTWTILKTDIQLIQQQLNSKGYVLTVDGIAGINTYNTVVKFQRENGLVADGMVGSSTLATLVSQTPSTTPSSTSEQIVSINQLNEVGWKNVSINQINELNSCLKTFAIITFPRLRHFISQCSYESECGLYTKEVDPGYKYEGREDLGNIYPGDGPKFKGAGYIQITGRSNYQSFSNYMRDKNIMDGVNYVAANYPWMSAGFWWYTNNMNSLCDSRSSVETITRAVNGGLNGFSGRQKYYDICLRVFRSDVY